MSIRILLVDDSPAMRRFIRRAIEMSGVEAEAFHEAGNGHEALTCIASERVDLVFCDINMPKMGGEEFLENLQNSVHRDTIPVIIVSTDATTTRMQRMRELGARDYLRKPFSPEYLRDAIDKALETSNA